jgi:hypothetical protein
VRLVGAQYGVQMSLRHPLPAAAVALTLAATAVTVSPASAEPREPIVVAALPLGPADLPQTRTTQTLQPGVTLTTIMRGEADPAARWTVEVAIPSPSPDPDAPATALSDQATAEETAAQLLAAGLDARVEPVPTPQLADAGGSVLGFRVRVGAFATRAEADALRAQVVALGLGGSSIFTGWDGEPDDVAGSRGPWNIQVLTIDPKEFRGTLDATFGPDLERRETTSTLAALTGAQAAVNAGFFVLNPAAGAPGDPAGVGVYDGALLSEPIAGRPALVTGDDVRGTSVERFWWRGSVMAAGQTLALDGLNRVPGLIRNCGGTADDVPTSLPLHDFTCTDDDELIVFDESYGPSTPSGPGVEVVLDNRGIVTAIRTTRGGPVSTGGHSVQATGDLADELLALTAIGRPLSIRTGLVDSSGRPAPVNGRTDIVNGGPELVRDGALWATPNADGMVHPDNPSFYYGFVHKRNPRTFAGVDHWGRTVLVTADGRSTNSLGLGIGETAAVAQALGLDDAINLDGGGSTTMVVEGVVVNAPSDASGERPVGDALVILGPRGSG